MSRLTPRPGEKFKHRVLDDEIEVVGIGRAYGDIEVREIGKDYTYYVAQARLTGPKAAYRGFYEPRVAKASAEGLDASGGKWLAICERHGTMVATDTMKSAKSSSTDEFCEECRAELP